jgi:uncharacterized membrane protein
LTSNATSSRRIAAVDLLRGLLMVVMALDHTREFFTNVSISPTDPVNSWPALFFTRWITHLCAPGFVALAGTSIYLQRQRGRSPNDIARKLVARGTWLIFVEIAIVGFGLLFTYQIHFLQVIYAIGGSMIILAALQYLPTKFVAAYGFLIVVLHNLYDNILPATFGHFATLWILLVRPGHGHLETYVAYPVLPWSGIMALGYAFGAVVMLAPKQRRIRCLIMSAISLTAFTILRLTNAYGDPVPFQPLPTFTHSAMSFFNVTKYPPSLLYTLATFGILLLLFVLGDLALEHRWLPRIASIFEVYGRVPFFYYVLHIYILHLLMVATLMNFTHTLHPQLFGPLIGTPLPGWGFSLPAVYAIWIAVVASLYYPCLWFSRLKSRRHDWWLSYL